MNIKHEYRQIISFIKSNTSFLTLSITMLLCLWGMRYMARGGVFNRLLVNTVGELFGNSQLTWLLAWSFGCVLFYMILPVIVLVIRRESLRDYGCDFRSALKHLPLYLVLFIPIGIGIFIAAGQEEFIKMYPFYRDPVSLNDLLLWELMYGLQFVSLEFFFRGFIIHGFKRHFGNVAAVLLMSLPYMMIHFPKPGLESLCAVVFGVVLAVASLRTNSILGGIMLHLTVALTMDFSALYHSGWFMRF